MPSLSDFKLDLSLDQELTMMGLSMAFMSSIVSAGSLILQIGINVQGTMIVSGHTAARKISSILMLPPASLMMALSSFVAQNIGAKEYERAEKRHRLLESAGHILFISHDSYCLSAFQLDRCDDFRKFKF